jgi:hypothetical protein
MKRSLKIALLLVPASMLSYVFVVISAALVSQLFYSVVKMVSAR